MELGENGQNTRHAVSVAEKEEFSIGGEPVTIQHPLLKDIIALGNPLKLRLVPVLPAVSCHNFGFR